MRNNIRTLALILMLILLPNALAEDVTLFAVNVGKGDALILKVGDWCGLIDTGKAKAMSRVKAALRETRVSSLDAVFLTHTDKDHAGGLEWLSESDIPVGTWYASAMYTGVKEKKHPAVKAAEARGEAVQWLKRGDVIPLGEPGAQLRVLAPMQLFEDTDDNNSLVMMLESAQGNILLTGDMELPEEASLLSQKDDLTCAILKVPHHGENCATCDELAQACSAQIGIISTDSQEKPGTPDPNVIARLNAFGTTCYVTQDSGLGFLATLNGGEATIDSISIDAPSMNVTIRELITEDDRIVLQNGGSDCDLSGWSLYSDRGNELYSFPENCILPANSSMTIGTKSSTGSFDLLWDDKKVIHKEKTDSIYLYDNWGRVADVVSNGI